MAQSKVMILRPGFLFIGSFSMGMNGERRPWLREKVTYGANYDTRYLVCGKYGKCEGWAWNSRVGGGTRIIQYISKDKAGSAGVRQDLSLRHMASGERKRISGYPWNSATPIRMRTAPPRDACRRSGALSRCLEAAHTLVFRIATVIGLLTSTVIANAAIICVGIARGQKDYAGMRRVLDGGLFLSVIHAASGHGTAILFSMDRPII